MDLATFFELQMYIVSGFGDSVLLVLLGAFSVSTFLFFKHYKKEAFFVLLTLLSQPYALLLKLIFQFPRPENTYSSTYVTPMPEINQYGFPSGHALFYMAFFGLLIYLSLTLTKFSKKLRIAVLLISGYLVLFVGVSRVYLGAHWIKDVIGGYFFGALFLAALLVIYKKLKI